MNLYIINNTFHYEAENLIRVFFPFEKVEKYFDSTDEDEKIKPFVCTNINDNEISVTLSLNEFEKTSTSSNDVKDKELSMMQLLYNLLCECTNTNPPWGLLTGIRPIKLFENISKEVGEEKAKDIFANDYFVSDKKLDLTLETYNSEKEIKALSKSKSFSLYISIPFCPSRCNYCSFVSSSITKTKHLIKDYIPLLCKEIEETAKIAKDLDLELLSVYIGGGTPTTLSAEQLRVIIQTVYDNFDTSNLREFTVEAGRPDTITRDKLETLKELKVDRISINPQTLSDSVLEAIGRKHTTKQTLDAFKLARECGFDNINMDLIAGLTNDTVDNFKDSINGIVDLDPESITVHTLALKSGSNLFMKGEDTQREFSLNTEKMVDYAYSKLKESDYHPYYLYRQSKMVGNLENVGYCKKGYESLYNIYVMEETHTILACGAGAVSKLRDQNSNYLERIFNFKYPFEYIDRFEEMILRKSAIIKFYNKYF